MGWKNVKEHYRIPHHVIVNDYKICIGSAYVHDLIVLDPWNKKITHPHSSLGRGGDLARYWDEMHADLDLLWELLEKPDTFAQDLVVYTYKDSEIIEKKCEAYGWPNVTHDGKIMYENMFSADRTVTLNRALRNAEARARLSGERIPQLEQDLSKAMSYHRESEHHLAKLRFEALYGSTEEPDTAKEESDDETY